MRGPQRSIRLKYWSGPYHRPMGSAPWVGSNPTVMPITYSFDGRDGRLLTHAEGVVTFDDINAHLDLEQRKRDLGRPEIIDAREAVTSLTADEVRRLVRRSVEMLRNTEVGPTAIVTTDDFTFVMARMYALLSERVGVNAEVFRDMQSARSWLGGFE